MKNCEIPDWYRWDGNTLILEVRVQPRSSRNQVVGLHDGRLKISVTAPPVDDAANGRLIRLLADEFGVPKSRVRLLAGATGRQKRIAIEAPAERPSWLEK